MKSYEYILNSDFSKYSFENPLILSKSSIKYRLKPETLEVWNVGKRQRYLQSGIFDMHFGCFCHELASYFKMNLVALDQS